MAQIKRRYVNQRELEQLTGISIRTLQRDHKQGQELFPSYKVRGQVLYDLTEVESIIKSSRRAEPAEVR
jgi:hypothetical protein